MRPVSVASSEDTQCCFLSAHVLHEGKEDIADKTSRIMLGATANRCTLPTKKLSCTLNRVEPARYTHPSLLRSCVLELYLFFYSDWCPRRGQKKVHACVHICMCIYILTFFVHVWNSADHCTVNHGYAQVTPFFPPNIILRTERRTKEKCTPTKEAKSGRCGQALGKLPK